MRRMNVTELVLIALALAMDATVYSFSYGLILRRGRLLAALWLALVVGLYQAGMPLIGYMGGMAVRDALAAWDHWIVLSVFTLLGLNVIRNAWGEKEGAEEGDGAAPLGFGTLMLVGIATSIDALAVGACMALGSMGCACGKPLEPGQLAIAVGIIGSITLVCSLVAFHAARPLQKLPTKWLETFAGLLLIALGVQNLLRDLL